LAKGGNFSGLGVRMTIMIDLFVLVLFLVGLVILPRLDRP
jgi:hypothetical protein